MKERIDRHKDGTIKARGHTVDDVLTGYWEWFRKDGTKMRSGYFENGKQAGEWTTYDAKRKVVKVTKMKSQGLSELPDAQRMARRCVKTTATLKISAAEDINIPGRNFHGGGVRNVAMNGDGF